MPSISLAVSLRGQLLSGTRSVVPAFSPIDLFSLNEPGVWYDPSDLTTLFTDTAGTTPVTTPAQTVALMLDKSKGLTLGTELVTSVWSGTGNAQDGVTFSGDDLEYWATEFSTVVGRTYKFTATLSGKTGNCQLRFRAGLVGQGSALYSSNNDAASVTVDQFIVATSTTSNIEILFRAAGVTATLSNISVRELPGNHATQATAASRPTFGVVPLGGRRNLLLQTEAFDTATWIFNSVLAFGSGSIANAAVAPNGTTTADLLVPNTTTSIHGVYQNAVAVPSGVSCTATFYVKPNGYTKMAIVENQTTGYYVSFNASGSGEVLSQSNATGAITPLDGGWYRITHTSVSGSALFRPQIFILPNSYTSGSVIGSWTPDGTSGIYIWGAQLETGSTATQYQRTTTQFDVTEAGVQSLSYLSFDGVDDFMLTGTITPGIDKVQVFAGVRKLSDAATGMIGETSTSAISNNGAFNLYTFTTPSNVFTSKGTVAREPVANSAAAPLSMVMAGLGDIAGDLATLRINGTQVAQSTGDQGTGNYLAYPLYIGRRGGTTLPFNGQLYSLVVRFGANLDAAAITNTETWVGDKTGINIANNISPTIFARDDTAVLDRFNQIIERRA